MARPRYSQPVFGLRCVVLQLQIQPEANVRVSETHWRAGSPCRNMSGRTALHTIHILTAGRAAAMISAASPSMNSGVRP
jgi:hypothetical protein